MGICKATLVGLAMAATVPIAMADQTGDMEFLTAAIAGNLAEIELGKLAQEKGQSEQVREYGARLVEDHENALKDARSAAEEIGVIPPRQPTPEALQVYESLAQLSGAEFDRHFAEHMITDHEEDIAAFRVQAGLEAHNRSAATEHAKATLPTLEEHLAMAQALNAGAPKR